MKYRQRNGQNTRCDSEFGPGVHDLSMERQFFVAAHNEDPVYEKCIFREDQSPPRGDVRVVAVEPQITQYAVNVSGNDTGARQEEWKTQPKREASVKAIERRPEGRVGTDTLLCLDSKEDSVGDNRKNYDDPEVLIKD